MPVSPRGPAGPDVDTKKNVGTVARQSKLPFPDTVSFLAFSVCVGDAHCIVTEFVLASSL